VNLTIFQKGLVLLAVPLVFQLAFVVVIVRFQRHHTEAERLAVHTKEVIAQAHEIQTGISDASAAVRGSVIGRDPAFVEPYRDAVRDLPGRLDALDELVSDNPTQGPRARSVRAAADAVLAWQDEVVRLVGAGATEEAANRVRSGRGMALMTDFRKEVAAFLAEEERLDRERTTALEESRARLNALFAAGGGAAVACTLLLAYGFRRGIARRFAALEANANRLASGAPLAAPLTGVDEIARVDRAFRDMAAALTRAADEVRDLYDNAPCGYHSVDPEGTLIAVNRTELRWLGYEAAEVVGRVRFADLLAPGSRGAYWATFARVKEHGSATDVELELVRKDGTTFPVLLNSTALRDAEGRYLRSRTTLTDLTERKRAEGAVLRLNAELEDRVRVRTDELETANRDLAQKNAENEMFVYSVSHDLRSPLVNLQGFSKELEKACRGLAELLAEEGVPADVRRRGQTVLDGKVTKSVGFIQAAVTRLSNIIDALLRLSRAGRVDYRWEAVDVAQIASQVVRAAQLTITERGAIVTVGALPPARGDRTAIEQVFGNLIGNALTYLDPARPGIIEVGALEAADGTRTYFVRDNGLGIAEGHRQKIFQAFQRAHPGVGTGEGLGLAIVARAVERHRGRVWVESRPGEGSTFYVTLPAPAAGG
jgi:PAS domain S-box-containing protein